MDEEKVIVPPKGFADLPNEILETILYQLPHGDLLPNATRVCRKWRDFISSNRFMPYKKLYYAYKKGKGPHFDKAQIEIKKMVRSEDYFMDGVRICFLGFIKRIGKFIPRNPDGSGPRIKRALQKMPTYPAVVSLFNEQSALKEFVETSQEPSEPSDPNPLCALATMLVLADDFDGTTQLLERLLGADDISLVLIMEIFYAAATFFLFFHRRLKIPDKHHYIVFAAIHSVENKMQVNPSTLKELLDRLEVPEDRMRELLQSVRFFRMTHEQYKIISYDIDRGEVVKINAFAGTGKTTTLISYTEVRHNKRFLYVAYNRSTRVDAEKRFPKNVTCRTIHSVAFAVSGRAYEKKNNRNPYQVKGKHKLGNLYPGDVYTALIHKQGFNTFSRATFARRTVENFVASTDLDIHLGHVPTVCKDGPIKEDHREQYLKDAIFLWRKMKDTRDTSVRMTHDGYLKLFQLLANVDFAKAIGQDPFHAILVDEAQDMTPASIDVLKRQTCAIVLVGDPNQQIYCFRGAVNAMSLIQGSTTFYLTQSFRFGPQIAHLCDSLLTCLKGIKDKTVIGNPNSCTIGGEVIGQLCVISRTNAEQFSEAVKAIECSSLRGCGNSQSPRPRIAFAGNDKKEEFFNQLKDVYHLYKGERKLIKNDYIKKFSSYLDLHKHSEKVEDVEILSKCQIVSKFKDEVYRHVEDITRHIIKDHEQGSADVVFSTAHKAKGLEFDTVKITDDYYVGPEFASSREDEKNLVYVAVSRAKKCLILNETLISILRRTGESFVSLRPNPDKVSAPLDPTTLSSPSERCVVKKSLTPGHPFLTTSCDRPTILENSWILHRPSMTIKLPYETESEKNAVREGSFCRSHGFMAMPAYIPFLETPCNLLQPKEKLHFSMKSLISTQEGAGDSDNEDVDYDKISINHFNPAFMRRGVTLVVDRQVGEIIEMMGLGSTQNRYSS